MITRRYRSALLLGVSMLALVLMVQPVAAVTVTSASGTFGLAIIPDAAFGKQGANCDYRTSGSNGHFRLKDISARGPKIYARDTGSGTQHQWVGWKYRIQGDTNFDNAFGPTFTSTVIKAKATDITPVAFARRTWTAPSNLKQGNYRVQVTLIWYKPGSSTQVQGKQIATVDYYKVAGGGPDTVRQNDCYYKNP